MKSREFCFTCSYSIVLADAAFVRGSNAAQHRPVGNGLGLYIVRKVVKQACGSIKLQSEEGKGSTVTVMLPGVG